MKDDQAHKQFFETASNLSDIQEMVLIESFPNPSIDSHLQVFIARTKENKIKNFCIMTSSKFNEEKHQKIILSLNGLLRIAQYSRLSILLRENLVFCGKISNRFDSLKENISAAKVKEKETQTNKDTLHDFFPQIIIVHQNSLETKVYSKLKELSYSGSARFSEIPYTTFDVLFKQKKIKSLYYIKHKEEDFNLSIIKIQCKFDDQKKGSLKEVLDLFATTKFKREGRLRVDCYNYNDIEAIKYVLTFFFEKCSINEIYDMKTRQLNLEYKIIEEENIISLKLSSLSNFILLITDYIKGDFNSESICKNSWLQTRVVDFLYKYDRLLTLDVDIKINNVGETRKPFEHLYNPANTEAIDTVTEEKDMMAKVNIALKQMTNSISKKKVELNRVAISNTTNEGIKKWSSSLLLRQAILDELNANNLSCCFDIKVFDKHESYEINIRSPQPDNKNFDLIKAIIQKLNSK